MLARTPYDGYVGLVSLDRDAADIKISPTDAAGQSVDTEDFYAAGDASTARSYFAAFRLLDTGAISEMRIKTAGKLHYISAGSAAEGNTVTVKPVAVRAEVQRYVQVTDDEGLPVFNADGTPKMQMVVFNEDINCFFGYFVFETSNAGVIVGCIAGGAALIGLILVGIFTGFFQKNTEERRYEEGAEIQNALLYAYPRFNRASHFQLCADVRLAHFI